MGVAYYTKDEKDRVLEVTYQSGLKVKPVYGPEDLKEIGFDYEKDLGDPGQYPYTRGIHPQGYR
ncbi:MAG: methylmalonyl-CoA mutase, partial [Deltaproteobacteria bacterium]|nr:methylmalonyl-CoA mutase [Deltaproteobacteria bacterium]